MGFPLSYLALAARRKNLHIYMFALRRSFREIALDAILKKEST